ncbi:MAG: hypothetical protein ACYTAF_12135 [Planctomycetota bacterium]|jgi:hypothetical protein
MARADFHFRKERFDEKGGRTPDGYCEFRYVGFNYEFDFGDRVYFARTYDDDRSRAHFAGWGERKQERKRKRTRSKGRPRFFGDLPYDDPLFRAAVQYLVDEEEIREVTVLMDEGYRSVEMDRLLGS